MDLNVTFCLETEPDHCVGEDEIRERFAALRPALVGNEDFEGAVLIEAAPQPTVRYQGFLEAAAQNLCFRAVAELAAGRRVAVKYGFYPGELRLTPEGGTTVLSGDFAPAIRVPTEDLVPALYECGVRFLELFRRLRGSDPEYGNAIADLARKAEAARRVLGREQG